MDQSDSPKQSARALRMPRLPAFLRRSTSERAAVRQQREDARLARERLEQIYETHPSARFPATQVLYDDPLFTEPPPLNYSLHPRIKYIVIFWTLVVIDCVAVPLVLYFVLWYHTGLSHNAVFSISTGALGTVSIVEYHLRLWRLYKKNSKCRVIGARSPLYFDFFHWNMTIGWIVVMAELIIGTIPANPPIRLLSMPATTMLFAIGTQMMILEILRLFAVPAPFRISSLPQGAPLRPAIYSIIEDVCAVDGSGGTEFRQRLNLRFLASKHFRVMLHRLTLFWSIGAMVIATVVTGVIFAAPDVSGDTAYIVGWTVPFAWAALWTAATIPYVKRELRREREIWTEDRDAATVPPRVGVTMRSMSRTADAHGASPFRRPSAPGPSAARPGVGPGGGQVGGATSPGITPAANGANRDVEKGEEELTAGEVLPAQAVELAIADAAAAEEEARGRAGAPVTAKASSAAE